MWPCLAVSALLVLTQVAAASDRVTATRLDGSSVSGQLTSWSDAGLSISTDDGEQTLQTDQLASLRWSHAPTVAAGQLGPIDVELVDGSVLTVVDYQSRDGSAVLYPDEAWTKDRELEISTAQVAVARLQQLDESSEAQWSEMLAEKLPSDVIVIRRSADAGLDYLEGVLGQVTATRVHFTLDEEEIPVKRAKVAGIVYFRPRVQNQPPPICWIHAGARSRFPATSVQWSGAGLRLTTPAGLILTVPSERLTWIDFSTGKIVYLSDLEPASLRWEKMIDLPAAAALARRQGEPKFDRAFYGGPLRLRLTASHEALERSNALPRDAEKTYAKGIAMRSGTELIYRLPRDFQRFVAIAGIDPGRHGIGGNAELIISGDDRTLLETGLSSSDPPLSIEVDITGFRKLAFRVNYGEYGDAGDLVNLCDAKITK